jgi:hypothetical protein
MEKWLFAEVFNHSLTSNQCCCSLLGPWPCPRVRIGQTPARAAPATRPKTSLFCGRGQYYHRRLALAHPISPSGYWAHAASCLRTAPIVRVRCTSHSYSLRPWHQSAFLLHAHRAAAAKLATVQDIGHQWTGWTAEVNQSCLKWLGNWRSNDSLGLSPIASLVLVQYCNTQIGPQPGPKNDPLLPGLLTN